MALVGCPECGGVVSEQATACPHCGHPIAHVPYRSTTYVPASPSKSRSTAALLALILGGIGVHKFYVGKPGIGILYALFCWTFIPAIAGFFEAIQYAMMSDDTFARKLANGSL